MRPMLPRLRASRARRASRRVPPLATMAARPVLRRRMPALVPAVRSARVTRKGARRADLRAMGGNGRASPPAHRPARRPVQRTVATAPPGPAGVPDPPALAGRDGARIRVRPALTTVPHAAIHRRVRGNRTARASHAATPAPLATTGPSGARAPVTPRPRVRSVGTSPRLVRAVIVRADPAATSPRVGAPAPHARLVTVRATTVVPQARARRASRARLMRRVAPASARASRAVPAATATALAPRVPRASRANPPRHRPAGRTPPA